MTRQELIDAIKLSESDDYILIQALLLSAEDVRLELKKKDDERQARLEERIYKAKMKAEGRCILCETKLTEAKSGREFCKYCRDTSAGSCCKKCGGDYIESHNGNLYCKCQYERK